MDDSVLVFLESHKDFVLCDNGKIRCTTTGHEMPCKADALSSYVNGKKYRMAKSCYAQDFTEYEPHIVPSKKHPKRLYCKLTKKELNKIPEEVEKHVNGKKYRQALKNLEEQKTNASKEQDGIPWFPEALDSQGEEDSEVDEEDDFEEVPKDSYDQKSENGEEEEEDEQDAEHEEQENGEEDVLSVPSRSNKKQKEPRTQTNLGSAKRKRS